MRDPGTHLVTPSLLLSACLLATLAGCSDSPAGPTPGMDVGRVQIDSVSVQIGMSQPVQVWGRVTGVVGDGCSKLLPIEQRRTGSLIEIEITRQRPRDAICTQIARLFDETVRLTGEFAPGAYRLRVNDTEQSFVVD